MINYSRPETREVLAPIDLAFVVGSVRAHAPELADDLDAAITIWLEHAGEFAVREAEPDCLTTRRSRLRALRELLALGPYEPDPRD
jgi:hypothetical protein